MNKTEKQLLIYGLPSLALALVSGFALWKINKKRVKTPEEQAHLERVKTIEDSQKKKALQNIQDYENDNEDFSDFIHLGGGGHRSKQNITRKSKTIRKRRKEN